MQQLVKVNNASPPGKVIAIEDIAAIERKLGYNTDMDTEVTKKPEGAQLYIYMYNFTARGKRQERGRH